MLVNESVCPLDQGAARINPLAGKRDAELSPTLPSQGRCKAVTVHAHVRRTCMHAADRGAAFTHRRAERRRFRVFYRRWGSAEGEGPLW